MCESVLSAILEGKTELNVLFRWLLKVSSKDDNFEELIGNRCLQGDFVSFFLNYIHEIQTCADKGETLQKEATTPKRIESTCPNQCENQKIVVKIRPTLFTDSEAYNGSTKTVTPTRQPHYNLNESYMSPLSPLYNNHNYSTPKYSSTPRSSRPNLCLSDFMSRSNRCDSKKKVQRNLNENAFVDSSPKTRRINPTNVTQKRSTGSVGFRRSSNSFNFDESQELINESSEGQRSFLVEERLKIISKRNSGDMPSATIVSNPYVVSRRREILPDPEAVTLRQNLDVAAALYGFLLKNCFVLNVTSELYFLLTVLLAKEYENTDMTSLCLGVSPLAQDFSFPQPIHGDIKSVLFKTIHNRVYFACKVLENQMDILKLLDSSTLRLLADNSRLKLFSSLSFHANLVVSNEGKQEKITERAEQVCFISDTDNRDNFPNDMSFHAFRKQRDLFYDILRIWETNHVLDEWNFVVALGGKIKALLNMHADPTNFVHLARLFKAQLLMNVCEKSSDNDAHPPILSTFPNVNAEKLSRLKDRLVTKQEEYTTNTPPTFLGHQEFYRDFILIASGHVFNRHLTDALIAEIVELNETKFCCTDLEDVDHASIRKAHLMSVKSLRILAKFLGFLECLPYKSEFQSQKILACHTRIRNQINPNLDLKRIIQQAMEKETLILTVPWVTEYLAMLDYITLRLSYYQDVFRVLFTIYHCDPNPAITVRNKFLIKFCLGWLFELPHFPENLYYDWLSRDGDAGKIIAAYNKNVHLDELDVVVDQNVLHLCCPYLEVIKKVLSSDASWSYHGHITAKHITPLTATQSSVESANKRLQLQLEENFFNGQPVSMRKTVEFISERVASACVKQICNEIVPAYKKKAVEDLSTVLGELKTDNLEEGQLFKHFAWEAIKFATISSTALRLKIDEQLEGLISERVLPAVKSLLAVDVLQQTMDVCISITVQNCTDRVLQWVQSHVNPGVFRKDFDSEARRFLAAMNGREAKIKPIFSLPTNGKDMEHDSSALSAVKVMENLRASCWDLLEKKETVTKSDVLDLLDSITRSIRGRCDLNESILVLINRMLVDYLLLLFAHRPDLVPNVSDFVGIWKECLRKDVTDDLLFGNLVCPKNVTLLDRSEGVEVAWRCFGHLLAVLVQEGMVTYADLQAQVGRCGAQNWTQETTNNLHGCLGQIGLREDGLLI